eukprot:m.11395 g.11395  ORF g.11395 m.11395 type:complete len:383 (+) comp4435_c0_seq1:62-1210(+)
MILFLAMFALLQRAEELRRTPTTLSCPAAVSKILGTAYEFGAFETSCPTFPFASLLSASKQQQHGKRVVISVGCNKGDDLLRASRIYNPRITSTIIEKHKDAFFTKAKELGAIMSGKTAWHLLEGSCGEFHSNQNEIDSTSQEGSHVVALCIEPLRRNALALKGAFHQSVPNPKELGFDYTIIREAVSDHEYTTRFPDLPPGWEQASLTGKHGPLAPHADMITTNVSTLPKILQQVTASTITFVDHLSIDVEGADVDVVKGAKTLFQEKRVGFVEFEVNSKGSWVAKGFSFGNFINDFDAWGYDCYFPTNKGSLIPLTKCLTEQHKRTRWGNVACVLRGYLAADVIREKALNLIALLSGELTTPWKPSGSPTNSQSINSDLF